MPDNPRYVKLDDVQELVSRAAVAVATANGTAAWTHIRFIQELAWRLKALEMGLGPNPHAPGNPSTWAFGEDPPNAR